MKLETYLKNKNIYYTVDNNGWITVGGYLDLRDTAITSLPDNLTVGVYLDLRDTAITSLPDNLTVGGYLDLRDTAITSLPDNLTVGGWLDLRDTGITDIPKNIKNVGEALKRKGMTLADGILAHVISTKKSISKIKIVGQREYSYLATSDDGATHAHGKTIQEAMSELAFKMSDKGDLSDLKNMPLETVKTALDWSHCYRRATGACKLGTDMFMKQNVDKDKYTLAEVLEKTNGAFGHERFKEVVGA